MDRPIDPELVHYLRDQLDRQASLIAQPLLVWFVTFAYQQLAVTQEALRRHMAEHPGEVIP